VLPALPGCGSENLRAVLPALPIGYALTIYGDALTALRFCTRIVVMGFYTTTAQGTRHRAQGTRQIVLTLVLLTLCSVNLTADAQTRRKKSVSGAQPKLSDRVSQAKADVIKAAQDYKLTLEKLLAFQEADVKAATETLDRRKALLEQGIVSKHEIETSERALADAQAKAATTKKQMGEADNLMAEAKASEQLEKLRPARIGAYQTTAALIRYNGPTAWVLADASKVESFFVGAFHRALPISALGQTAVHTQLGFDHSHAMDVAVHPDSVEGQALMNYLRNAGVPFIAFRQAVPGSATGAHIHIGQPSHRIR